MQKAHFYLWNNWVDANTGHCYKDTNEPLFIKDASTDDLYLNEDLLTISSKCLLLILASPIIHTCTSLLYVVMEILCLFFDEEHSPYKHLMNIALHTVAPIVLTLSALYGVFFPLSGRKIYASFERLIYAGGLIAPCFQPFPKEHLFGGDLKLINSW